MQMAWINGLYVKAALQSTILMCGLADNKTANKLPKFPKMPRNEENNPITQEEIEAQKQYNIAKMQFWTKMNNSRFKKK